jgi:hypothetical protein
VGAPVFEATKPARTPKTSAYAISFAALAAAVFAIHGPYLTLPYFWDELGQFVPAALDILRDGLFVPISTVPNVHPPGVMAYLALVWKVFGYSIVATRAAMLLIAAVGVFVSFLLAIRLCRGCPGTPAFTAILLLLVTPLFFTQAMMAQLDMPAMTLSILALLLFIEDRFAWSAAACTALVLVKETGAIEPVLFGAWLILRERRWKEAAYFIAPFVPLAAWLYVLWNNTGNILGDSGFAHYNVAYSLHPVRIAASLVRRFYFLFLADFRWIGSLALVLGWRRMRGLFTGKAWAVAGLFAIVHTGAMCVFGGAALERYLLPVFPILYAAMAAAWSYMPRTRRLIWEAACLAGMFAGFFWNSPFPAPMENNLAMIDFVELQRGAAEFLDDHAQGSTVASAWPYTAALREPDFGFVSNPFTVIETEDFHASNVIRQVAGSPARILVVYSRTWEPAWGVLRSGAVRDFLVRYYEYEPQITGDRIQAEFGMSPVYRLERRGQWVQVYAR